MSKILIVVLFMMNCSSARTQEKSTPNALAPEKVYLQIDRAYYATDQTIWFRAVVTDAVDHTPTSLSGVLHVELIAPDERVVERKLLKLNAGIGKGFFELHDNMSEGNYLLRAYTEWNKNFDDDYIFEEYITLFSSSAENSEDPIKEIILVEKGKGQFRLNARLRPVPFDDTLKRKLSVYLDIDGQKDTLTLIKNDDDDYFLDYAVPDDMHLATLIIVTENKKRYSKTVSLNPDILDVQFFPESGVMVDGLNTKVGFKVLNDKGKGISVEGTILDAKGNAITSFKSNNLGMGTFFIKPNSNTTYHARVSLPSDSEALLEYAMPKVVREGTILSVRRAKNNIGIVVCSNYKKKDSIFIMVQSRGQDLFRIDGQLEGGRLLTNFPQNKLPEGILVFSLLDHHMRPLAERLFFNERTDSRLKIQCSLDQKIYTAREKATLKMDVLNNEGMTVNAHLSVLILDQEVQDTRALRPNILSYFLVDSELKGRIENPNYYFNVDNKNRWHDIDALMLTQGWRKFKFQKLESARYKPEVKLKFSGSVSSPLSKNMRKTAVDLKLLAFGKTPSFYEKTTDSLGKFDFELDDEYGSSMDVLVQSINSSGRRKSYAVLFDKKESPKIKFNHLKSIEDIDSIAFIQVDMARKRKLREDAFEQLSGVTRLEEVVVEATRLTPQRKKVTNIYGVADVTITGKDIRKREKKWSYGLYSVLLFNYPKEISIERFPDGFMLAHIKGGGTTLVVIDGIPVMDYNYPLLPRIPPSEVKSVELIKSVKNFFKLYTEVFPRVPADKVPTSGSVISIYTYAGNGIHSIKKPVGLLEASIPIFSPEREFYAPRYDSVENDDLKKPDLRSLMHWVPDMKLNGTATANTSFYTADIPGKKIIVVEAIADNGTMGYQEMIFEVKEE